jgi:hypothetical protein
MSSVRDAIHGAHRFGTSIGAGAFDYDFGALENTNNKLTKSYKNLVCVSFPSNISAIVTVVFHSFDAFGRLSKGEIFMMDALGWVPTGFITWIFEMDKRPGMARLRENRKHAHEVAAKLIEEKRQELKDGNPQRDVMTLLGSSRATFVGPDTWYNFQPFSQGEFLLETRLAAERPRNCRPSSVNSISCFPSG